MMRLLFVALCIAITSGCSFTGRDGEPLPPFFGDYGKCLQPAPNNGCSLFQYPDGTGPIYLKELAKYKQDHAEWWREQMRIERAEKTLSQNSRKVR